MQHTHFTAIVLAISSGINQLQFIKLEHFKLEIFKSIVISWEGAFWDKLE